MTWVFRVRFLNKLSDDSETSKQLEALKGSQRLRLLHVDVLKASTGGLQWSAM